MVRVTQSDAGGTVTLPPGDALVVELPENPTTGYRWELAGPGALADRVSSDFDPPPPGLAGAAGVRRFTVHPPAAGSYQVELVLRRPWEQDAPPRERWAVTVVVGPSAP
jgi:inhibitor of cysteine peptidase